MWHTLIPDLLPWSLWHSQPLFTSILRRLNLGILNYEVAFDLLRMDSLAVLRLNHLADVKPLIVSDTSILVSQEALLICSISRGVRGGRLDQQSGLPVPNRLTLSRVCHGNWPSITDVRSLHSHTTAVVASST